MHTNEDLRATESTILQITTKLIIGSYALPRTGTIIMTHTDILSP